MITIVIEHTFQEFLRITGILLAEDLVPFVECSEELMLLFNDFFSKHTQGLSCLFD